MANSKLFGPLHQVRDAFSRALVTKHGSRSSNQGTPRCRLLPSSPLVMGNSHVVRLSDFVISLLSWCSFPDQGAKPFPTILTYVTLGRVLVRALWPVSSDMNATLSAVLRELCA
jgi:hypothetical protein